MWDLNRGRNLAPAPCNRLRWSEAEQGAKASPAGQESTRGSKRTSGQSRRAPGQNRQGRRAPGPGGDEDQGKVGDQGGTGLMNLGWPSW